MPDFQSSSKSCQCCKADTRIKEACCITQAMMLPSIVLLTCVQSLWYRTILLPFLVSSDAWLAHRPFTIWSWPPRLRRRRPQPSRRSTKRTTNRR